MGSARGWPVSRASLDVGARTTAGNGVSSIGLDGDMAGLSRGAGACDGAFFSPPAWCAIGQMLSRRHKVVRQKGVPRLGARFPVTLDRRRSQTLRTRDSLATNRR